MLSKSLIDGQKKMDKDELRNFIVHAGIILGSTCVDTAKFINETFDRKAVRCNWKLIKGFVVRHIGDILG